MRYKKTLSVLALAAVFAAMPAAGCLAANGQSGKAAVSAASTADHVYENLGFRLSVPKKYDSLVLTKVYRNNERGRLFSAYEKASVEAAKAAKTKHQGAGWLFTIGAVDDNTLHKMLCFDMSGAELFARDSKGNNYIFYHPTDVRYFRADNEQMARDQEQWTAVNSWSFGEVRGDFVKDNPSLTALAADNSDVGIYLARVMYDKDMQYVLSKAKKTVKKAAAYDAASFAAPLLYNVKYQYVETDKMPRGEYVSLIIPQEKTRFDFFVGENANYVRKIESTKRQMLYKAEFADTNTSTGQLIEAWYEDMASDRDMAQLGYTPDSLVGTWAEKIVGRCHITIAKNADNKTYNVSISWGDSASRTYYWTMTAKPSGSNSLSYENGRCSIIDRNADGSQTETVQYENGTGCFVLNSTNELMWQENENHAADDAVFVSTGK